MVLPRNWSYLWWTMGFPVAQMLKIPPAMRETQVWSLAWEDPLGKGKATHSSIFAWGISWTEELGGLQPMGSQRVRHNSVHMHVTSNDLFPTLILLDLVATFGKGWLFFICWVMSSSLWPHGLQHPQASLSFTISQSLLKFISTDSVMLSNHLILCHPFFCLQSFQVLGLISLLKILSSSDFKKTNTLDFVQKY